MDMKIQVYYFSGTGNSYWSAKKLAENLGGELIAIRQDILSGTLHIEAQKVIFLFPSYAYQSPLLVRRFIENTAIKAEYIAAIVTYGSSPGGTLAEIAAVLRRKNLRLSYAGKIPCVENYIPIFGSPSAKKLSKRLALQTAATEAVTADIRLSTINNVWIFRPLSSFIGFLFRTAKPFFVKGYKINKACTACGLCAKLCPAHAIAMIENKPHFSSACEHCQACFNWCPSRAIEFIRLKPNTPRYHHPLVEAAELIPQSIDEKGQNI
jgi:ferredoxin